MKRAAQEELFRVGVARSLTVPHRGSPCTRTSCENENRRSCDPCTLSHSSQQHKHLGHDQPWVPRELGHPWNIAHLPEGRDPFQILESVCSGLHPPRPPLGEEGSDRWMFLAPSLPPSALCRSWTWVSCNWVVVPTTGMSQKRSHDAGACVLNEIFEMKSRVSS